MSPIGYHVRISLEGRRVIASTTSAQRCVARVCLEQGARAGLIAFRLADTHLHSTLTCTRPEAGAFVHHVECGLRWSLGPSVAFERPHFEPIESQRHLASAFWYDLRQEQHHGTALDPLHEASSLPDTLGLRVVDPALPARVAQALPRTRQAELVELLTPNASELMGAPLRLALLADSAAAAFALPALGSSHNPVHTLARRSAIEVALANPELWSVARSHRLVSAIAQALGLSRGGTHRLATKAPSLTATNPAALRAVLGQWQLRSTHLRTRPTATVPWLVA